MTPGSVSTPDSRRLRFTPWTGAVFPTPVWWSWPQYPCIWCSTSLPSSSFRRSHIKINLFVNQKTKAYLWVPFLRKRFYSKILDQRFTDHLYLYLLGLWTGASSNWPVRQFVCKTIVIPLQYLSGGSKGMIQSNSRLFGVSMIWLSHDCLCQPLPPPPIKWWLCNKP